VEIVFSLVEELDQSHHRAQVQLALPVVVVVVVPGEEHFGAVYWDQSLQEDHVSDRYHHLSKNLDRTMVEEQCCYSRVVVVDVVHRIFLALVEAIDHGGNLVVDQHVQYSVDMLHLCLSRQPHIVVVVVVVGEEGGDGMADAAARCGRLRRRGTEGQAAQVLLEITHVKKERPWQ